MTHLRWYNEFSQEQDQFWVSVPSTFFLLLLEVQFGKVLGTTLVLPLLPSSSQHHKIPISLWQHSGRVRKKFFNKSAFFFLVLIAVNLYSSNKFIKYSQLSQPYLSTVWGGFLGSSADKESTCNVVGFLGSGRFPGEGTATHFSILAWRTSWTV